MPIHTATPQADARAPQPVGTGGRARACWGAQRLFLVLLSLLLLSTAPAWANDDAVLLRALSDEDGDGYDAALETWEGLDEERRITLLRDALHGEDDVLAMIAARALGPEHLSWSEIHRQMELLVRDPAWVLGFRTPEWAPGHGAGLGGPDVVPLFRHAAEDTELSLDLETWQEVHRVASPAHVPDLVPLLQRAQGTTFEGLLWNLQLLSAYDAEDEHRAPLARAFLYALERRDADAAGRQPPRLADVEVALTSDEPGLPPAFARLVLDPDIGSVEENSVHWIRRWAHELEPAARDVSLLRQLAHARDSYLPFWALRHLARIGTPEALAFVEALAEAGGSLGVLAAAALFEAGHPARWESALAAREVRGTIPAVAWAVDRVRARALWLANPDDSIEPTRRHALACYEGIEVARKDLAILAESMQRADCKAIERARFFSEIYPRGLTVDLAQQIARELRDVPVKDLQTLDLERLLGVLEGAAPEAVRTLLDGRAGLDQWLDALWSRLEPAAVDLETLKTRARAPDLETSEPALLALAVRGGVPRRVVLSVFEMNDGLSSEEQPFPTARRLILEGDPVGAMLHLREHQVGPCVHELGLLDDDRARRLLHRYRAERHHGLYWQATAGLAIAGDEDARAEFLALLEDDRTWMFDNLLDRTLILEEDPRLGPFWLTRLDTNCCLQFHAHTALNSLFPTLPYEQLSSQPLFQPVAAWYRAAMRRGFAWSRILDGWVPRAP